MKTMKRLTIVSITLFLTLSTLTAQQWENHNVSGLTGNFKSRDGIVFKKYNNTYYAFTTNGLFQSSNMVDWTCLTCSEGTALCHDILITDNNDTLISWNNNVYKRNAGSWDSVASIGRELYLFDNGTLERIFTGSWCEGLAYSDDGGDTWTYYSQTTGTEMGDGLSNRRCSEGVAKFFYYNKDSNIVLTSGKTETQFSYDFGENWTWRDGNLDAPDHSNGRAFDGRTWVGDDKAWIYFSTSGGNSSDPTFAKSVINDSIGKYWHVYTRGLGKVRTIVSYGYYLFAGGSIEWDVVQVTKDNGISFEPFNSGLTLTDALGFFIDTVNQDSIMLYAVENGSTPSSSNINKINLANLPKLHTLTFNIFDTNHVALNNVNVSIDNQSTTTNNIGKANVYAIEEKTEVVYSIEKAGYYSISDTVDITSQPTIVKIDSIQLEPLASYTVDYTILNQEDSSAVFEASVDLNSIIQLTDVNGETSFNDIYEAINIPLLITKSGFYNFTDTIDIKNDIQDTIYLSPIPQYDVSFTILNKSDLNPIENAMVILDQDTLSTNSSGSATFNDIQAETGIPYKITVSGIDSIGTIDIIDKDVNKTVMFNITSIKNTNLISSSSIDIFPNPADNKITMKLGENLNGKLLISIHNIMGKVVDEFTIGKDSKITTKTIDLSNYSKGVYFITLYNNNIIMIKKFLKK